MGLRKNQAWESLPDIEIHDTLGRPLPISRGEVIRQVL
jgi:hypothetical protein